MAVTAAGAPYVVASRWEDDNFLKNTAFKLDAGSNTWATFGGDFISDGQAAYNDLAVDNANNYLVLTYTQDGTKVKRISLPVPTQTCSNTDPGNNAGDLGCVTFTYRGQSVTYTTVRCADGRIWLQQNLGSSKVATSFDDADSYGDLFQWGRWDDGHQVRNSLTSVASSPNSPDGLSGTDKFIIGSGTDSWWGSNATSDTWTAASSAAAGQAVGVDPCKAIGQGWRLPTSAEWVTIANNYSMNNPASAYASHLKLPAGGVRSNTSGGFNFVGQRGYFWSSETSTSGGRFMYVGGTIITPASGGPRGQGESVRCTKDVSTGLGTSDLNSKANSIGIYPNPTNGILNIRTDSSIESVNVINVVGQKVNMQFSDKQINMQGLPNGVYIVELKLKNGKTFSKKVVKN
ncbi:T9SS type A sorting domain-containing protein [Chryseobacterium arachidis]|uniref:T9SS type A sorting domain-containing protein n=1 Tax=Chryseobacterium arachidis TaxID=1416778 RepID=UPI00360F3FFD